MYSHPTGECGFIIYFVTHFLPTKSFPYLGSEGPFLTLLPSTEWHFKYIHKMLTFPCSAQQAACVLLQTTTGKDLNNTRFLSEY